ncbi:hypothetical protein [Sulfuriroseicoccus oceanibius]|uniref:Uncharacterized protein n=1 Tax=Sulfuriroseicoccus oceanibius TaxID=2707525 RepID=A0A6B3L8I5_9BACT|nr:hypothetical protein [Sulfuriroseicoccus oceanibius]QQL46142.1 hypothetical protein G3M56_006050 [Sulfuriroseicoccus oceanibius]
MSNKLKFGAASLLAMAFCAATFTSHAEQVAPASEGRDVQIVAKVVPFILTDQSGNFRIEVKDDGSLDHGGNTIAILGDGGLVVGTDGTEIARLKPNGQVVTRAGAVIGEVLENGNLKMGDGRGVSWITKAANGGQTVSGKAFVELGDDGDIKLTLEPDTPEARRWAAVQVLLSFTVQTRSSD